MKIAMGLTLAVAALAGGWYITADGSTTNEAAADPGTLRTAAVVRRDVGATVLATGVIRPKIGAEVRVGSRVSGVLHQLNATVGERVRKGQLLAQLDSAPFWAAYLEAQAALANARAESAFAAGEFERARELRDVQAVTPTEFAGYERARAVTAAQVDRAAAQLEAVRIQLGYTRITAPISGVVASVSTQVGETVAASFAAPTFVTIIDLDRLEVWAYVDETDIGRVEVGQRARFTVDTYVDTEFTGVVSAIRPQAEIQNAVVNYVTVIRIDPGHGRILRPEMTTTTNILLDGRTDALAIPNGAVRRDENGVYALVSGDTGAPLRRSLSLGFRGREYTEVIDGVREGDRVVVGSLTTPAR
jgi:macrolide-specific efflux system membrane fusion protein